MLLKKQELVKEVNIIMEPTQGGTQQPGGMGTPTPPPAGDQTPAGGGMGTPTPAPTEGGTTPPPAGGENGGMPPTPGM